MRVYKPHLLNKPAFISRNGKFLPKPFPGKAPTRLFIAGTNGNKKFLYHGKPFSTLYQQFQDFSANPERMELKCVVVEYDRAGVVFLGRISQAVRENTVTLIDPLWAHYHPQIAHQPILHWLHWPFVVNEHHQYLIA